MYKYFNCWNVYFIWLVIFRIDEFIVCVFNECIVVVLRFVVYLYCIIFYRFFDIIVYLVRFWNIGGKIWFVFNDFFSIVNIGF